MTKADRPPKTIRVFLVSAKMFLLESDVELSQRFWRRLRRRIQGSRARTIDRVPSNKELRDIMKHLDIHCQALFLLLASSGMRIGEALQLSPEDIDLTRQPAKVTIRGQHTKSGNPRTTFLSREAVEALKQWLPHRDNYLDAASRKSRHKKAS